MGHGLIECLRMRKMERTPFSFGFLANNGASSMSILAAFIHTVFQADMTSTVEAGEASASTRYLVWLSDFVFVDREISS